MTNQKAINILLNERKCIDRNDGTQCDRKCESCDLVMDAEQIREAYSMAISALEKQIPKKPIRINKNKYFDGNWKKVCPLCGRMLIKRITTPEKSFPWHYNYTQHCLCGQAIDWENE